MTKPLKSYSPTSYDLWEAKQINTASSVYLILSIQSFFQEGQCSICSCLSFSCSLFLSSLFLLTSLIPFNIFIRFQISVLKLRISHTRNDIQRLFIAVRKMAIKRSLIQYYIKIPYCHQQNNKYYQVYSINRSLNIEILVTQRID